jgi:quercetin dioxygenase-like cupin family protein
MTDTSIEAAACAALRERVLARVRRSVAQHREYRTVRREDASWLPLAPGLAGWTLRDDGAVVAQLLRLDDGCVLPWGGGVQAQELLVLDGALTEIGGERCHLRLAHGARLRGEVPREVRAGGPTRVYLRQLRGPVRQQPDLESRWWLSAPGGWTDPSGRRWHEAGDGVEVLPLRGDEEVASMLVRFAPGGAVADHRHALDEDCLVLEGEMFLGDILLRAGDYQLAPAGGGHFGECSERGVLFFFHGALDPVLRAERSPGRSSRQPRPMRDRPSSPGRGCR